MATVIHRLDQALRYWEACARYFSLLVRTKSGLNSERSYTAGVMHWRQFRKDLLRGLTHERIKVYENWGGIFDRDTPRTFVRIPQSVAAWTYGSREVFHLHPNLQAMLELTSTRGLLWGDILWPYHGYAITLDRPIQREDGLTVDTMIVSALPQPSGKTLVSIQLLDVALERWTPPSSSVWDKLENWQMYGKWKEIDRELPALKQQTIFADISCPWMYDTYAPDERVRNMSERWLEEALKIRVGRSDKIFWAQIIRVVLGLNLYLSTLPPGSGQRQEGPRPLLDPKVQGITAAAHVCTVVGHRTLTDEEQESLGPDTAPRLYRQIRPHWRRGHYRRMPGHGHDPKAPRCVRIDPVYIHKDLVEPGMQVGGGEVDVE